MTVPQKRDKFMMLVATGARMALGLFTFILMARFLGPTQFGVIATAIAFASVLGMLTNFGLMNYSLRQAAMDIPNAARIVGDALASKAVLSAVGLPIAIGLILAFLPQNVWFATICIFVGVSLYSFADLSIIIVRVHRRFDVEAKLIVTTAVIMLALVGGAAYSTGQRDPTAAAFLASRLIYLVVVQWGLRPWLEPIRNAAREMRSIAATMRAGAQYAVDSMLTALSNQIDVMVFAAMISISGMGIYQAGARLVQAIVPVAVVLSNVYLPSLSAAHAKPDHGEEFRAVSRRMNLEFFGLAAVAAAFFYVGGPFVTDVIYGPAYAPLTPLWPGFAAFAFSRTCAAGYGIETVAAGRISWRVVTNVVSLIAFILAALLIIPATGLAGASTAMAVMGSVNFVMLGCRAIALSRSPFSAAMFGLQILVLGSLLVLSFRTWS